MRFFLQIYIKIHVRFSSVHFLVNRTCTGPREDVAMSEMKASLYDDDKQTPKKTLSNAKNLCKSPTAAMRASSAIVSKYRNTPPKSLTAKIIEPGTTGGDQQRPSAPRGSKHCTLTSHMNNLCAERALLYALNHVPNDSIDNAHSSKTKTPIQGTKLATQEGHKHSPLDHETLIKSQNRDFNRARTKLSKTPVRPPALEAAPNFS